MRIAIFHDYIGAIGGGEKLVLTLAKGLGADVITTDVDMDSVKKMGFEDINIISLGKTVKLSPLKTDISLFEICNVQFFREIRSFCFFWQLGSFRCKATYTKCLLLSYTCTSLLRFV